ncbi:MAG: hypothetical protein AAF738_03180, partial [Bacteroidota bacterium]
QTFDRFGLLMYYHLNVEYIAEFLCINKDKPELVCNGKCYLVAELEKQQEELPIHLTDKQEVQFVTPTLSSSARHLRVFYDTEVLFAYQSHTPRDVQREIFRPPIL